MAIINGTPTDDTLNGTNLADTINGLGGNDTLNGLDGNDVIDGGVGNDSMTGGAGNDTFVVESFGDTVVEDVDGGTDTVRITRNNASLVTATLIALNEAGTLDSFGFGNVENVQVVGTGLYNISGSIENNLLSGNASANAIFGDDGNDTIAGGGGNDSLDGEGGDDSMLGGIGNDTYVVDSAGDVVSEAGGSGIDLVQSSVSITLAAGVDNLLLTGVSAINGTGNTLANVITGNAEANTLDGGTGNDSLVGGGGVDTLIGGAGNDTYVVDGSNDVVTETLAGAAGGVDLVQASDSFTLGTNVENLTLLGNEGYSGTGNGLANRITGNEFDNALSGLVGNDTLTGGNGNDSLDGGDGIDSMIGGAGSDTYVVGTVGDAVVEAANAGTDLVRAGINYTLGLNVEDLTLTGTTNLNGTGNTLANTIAGNTGNNVLSGLGGEDNLSGGDGNDRLDGGTENDTLSGGEGNDTLLGGTGNDNIAGGAGNDSLVGGAGVDTMAGGADSDRYVVDSSADVVTELVGGANGAFDNVSIAYNTATAAVINMAVTYANVENLDIAGLGLFSVSGSATNNIISGNASNNTLSGLGGNDILIGGAGNDTLDGGDANDFLDGGLGNDSYVGGLGNDSYVLQQAGDVIAPNDAGGTDVVFAFFTTSIADRPDLENIELRGSGAFNATGNGAANLLGGNAGANRLDGGLGADVMIGGAGNDTYVVDDAGDQAREDIPTVDVNPGGVDLVISSVSFTLDAAVNVTPAILTGVENLTLNGSDNINGTGNQLNNVILGNAGNNTLTGNAGNDNLNGGAGNDSLVGGAGNDVMTGGTGDDTYVVDATGDLVVEANLPTAGTDIVQASINYVLAAGLENLVLTGTGNLNATGNAGVNSITGNAGNNRLDGAGGDDILTGGDGNDTYVLSSAGDSVNETGAADTADSIVVGYARTPAAAVIDLTGVSGEGSVGYTNIEHVTITGLGTFNVVGNAANNIIVGNASNNRIEGGEGNDSLTGGLGTDTLVGGSGNDTYVVDATDVLEESTAAEAGTDTVESLLAIDLSLARFDGIENATLLGTGAVNLTGDAGNNVLTGNTGANLITGGAGDDTMVGGNGNDTYVVSDELDAVTETNAAAAGGIDTVRSSLASYTLTANVENLVLLEGAESGTGNAGRNAITGNTGANRLDGGEGIDTMTGGAGDDTYVVDNALDVVSETLPLATGGEDTVESSINYTLGANLDNLVLTGAGNINGTGNTLDNELTGNDGNNLLSGAAGADLISGGVGNDTLDGGAGADTLNGEGGADVFVFNGPNLAANADTITDFLSGTDVLQLENAVYTLLGAPGALNVDLFATITGALGSYTGLATEANDRLVFNTDTGELYYDTNGSAAGGHTLIATLFDGANVTPITAADIQVI